MNLLNKLSPLIDKKIKNLRKAENNLKQQLNEIQSSCSHQLVIETPWWDGDIRRMCVHCLFEEQGSNWSGGNTWSVKDYSHSPVLGNIDDRVVANVSWEEFFRYRINNRHNN